MGKLEKKEVIMNSNHDLEQITQNVAPWAEIDLTQHSLPDITWRELLLWILRFRRRVRVTGPSMRPLLKPNDEVLVDINAYRQEKPKVGDVVVAIHPNNPHVEMIKRVTEVFAHNRYFLKGDNSAFSTDSRSFGVVELNQLLGRVTCRFA